MFQETRTFQVQSTQITPVTSWRSVYTRWLHMQPVRRSYLQWWFLLFTSENPTCTSWVQVSHNISSHNQLVIQAPTVTEKKPVPESKIDTCTDVNIMPVSVYKLVLCNPDFKKFAPSRFEIGTYTTDTMKLAGSCTFYLVHPDTKCLQEVTVYVASNNGSVLLSCVTMLALGLIQPHTRLDYLPSRASLIASSADHPKRNKCQLNIHVSKRESTVCNWPSTIPKLITSREQVLQAYPDVFDGIGCFPGQPYHIHVEPSVTLKQTSCWPVSVHLKVPFKQEIDKMLQAGILKPVHQATPWINSFVLVEGKDKLGKFKIRICLDPTNLNKAIVHKHITLKHQPILHICLQIIKQLSYRWRKRLQVLLFSLIITLGSKTTLQTDASIKGHGTCPLQDAKTSVFCKQGSHRCPEKLCCNWIGICCSGLGNGEIPPFSIHESFLAWNRSETAWSHIT